MASLGTGCSVFTTLIAMVLSIFCFDPGIGCSNFYGWHRSKMLVFSPLTDAWVLSSGSTLILVLCRVPHWCDTSKYSLLTLFWCLDFETMDVSAMQWSAPFSICIVRVYYVLSFKCSLIVICGVFCSSADYVIRAGRLGSLLWLLLPDDYHDWRANVLLTLYKSLLLLWLSFSAFITWITSVAYYTYWICPSIWHGLIASVLSSAKTSILCTCNFLVLHIELIKCAVGFLLSNCISCSLSNHREFSILQVGLLQSIQGQQFNCFTGCNSDLCSSPKLLPKKETQGHHREFSILQVGLLQSIQGQQFNCFTGCNSYLCSSPKLLPKKETQGFIPAACLLVHMMFSFGSVCTLEATLCQVNGHDGGLFILANTLFDIDIEPADGLAPVWNKDVRFYRIKFSSGNPIAYFYFDPYSRPAEKCGGAWLDEGAARSRALVRNGASARLPVGDKPNLMTVCEVAIIFHEFGYALQHMLTKEHEGLVSDILVIEWAAVELPSQYMENWCYERDALMSIANPMKLVRHFMILLYASGFRSIVTITRWSNSEADSLSSKTLAHKRVFQGFGRLTRQYSYIVLIHGHPCKILFEEASGHFISDFSLILSHIYL